jgi:hypothetical protein
MKALGSPAAPFFRDPVRLAWAVGQLAEDERDEQWRALLQVRGMRAAVHGTKDAFQQYLQTWQRRIQEPDAPAGDAHPASPVDQLRWWLYEHDLWCGAEPDEAARSRLREGGRG